MVCSTELDLSHELQLEAKAGDSGSWWSTDFSLIKALEKDNILPMERIDEDKASVLL